jgi:DNA-binding NarL/FixJ family response regulator
LDPRAASAVISALRTDTNSPTQEDLSTRELEVLDLVAKGLLNKQIAKELSIAESTVKAHLTQIYGRIGVSDRLQATLWAQRNDIGRSGLGQEST